MSIIESIKKARERGISDENIFEKIKESNPGKKEIFEEAIKRGATFTQIINEIIAQSEERERKKGGGEEKIRQGERIETEKEKKQQKEFLTPYPVTLIPKTSKKPSLFQKVFIRIVVAVIVLSLLSIIGFFYFAGFFK